MIMPAKWYNAGRGLEQFRSDMLNDKSISKLYDYVDPHGSMYIKNSETIMMNLAKWIHQNHNISYSISDPLQL